MTVKEQRLEGEYRHINSRLIVNSEEIAFYGGNNREKLTVLTSFYKLVSLFTQCVSNVVYTSLSIMSLIFIMFFFTGNSSS